LLPQAPLCQYRLEVSPWRQQEALKSKLQACLCNLLQRLCRHMQFLHLHLHRLQLLRAPLPLWQARMHFQLRPPLCLRQLLQL